MFLLQNDRLAVEIAESGELYQAPRFDWAGIVKQVTLDGIHTFLSEESASMSAMKNGGIGIIGSFEPAPATFLQKVNYICAKKSEKEVIFQCHMQSVSHTKILHLEGSCLEITHVVKNTGTEAFSFGEYNHNFMLIDGYGYGPDYQVHFSFPAQLTGRKEGYYNRFNLQNGLLTVTEPFGEPPEDALTQIEGFAGEAQPFTWELLHVPTGLYVREEDDFPIWKYQFWCRQDNICNEVFVKNHLEPDQQTVWKRRYTFGKR